MFSDIKVSDHIIYSKAMIINQTGQFYFNKQSFYKVSKIMIYTYLKSGATPKMTSRLCMSSAYSVNYTFCSLAGEREGSTQNLIQYSAKNIQDNYIIQSY